MIMQASYHNVNSFLFFLYFLSLFCDITLHECLVLSYYSAMTILYTEAQYDAVAWFLVRQTGWTVGLCRELQGGNQVSGTIIGWGMVGIIFIVLLVVAVAPLFLHK